MGYTIITDSSADLPRSYYKEHSIPCIPLHIAMGTETYPDDGARDSHDFFERMRAGEMATTSQISIEAHVQYFEKEFKAGNDILFLGLSSGISDSHRNARSAKEELKERYPDRTVCVVDTVCVSLGLGLLVHEAVVRHEAGMGFEELCAWVEQNHLRFHHLFTVSDLMFLHKGGRVSRTSAVVGSMLGIKPLLHVSPDGKLLPNGKVRGRAASLIRLVEDMADKIDGNVFDNVMISHGDCEEEARFVMNEVKKRYTVKSELINSLGATIGAHAGPGTMALFFIGKERTQ